VGHNKQTCTGLTNGKGLDNESEFTNGDDDYDDDGYSK